MKFRSTDNSLKHGTVTVRHGGEDFEITTLRVDRATDGRNAEVEFTTDWREDALRRDFTFNAMFVDTKGNLHDFFEGQEHLRKGLVRFVGDAEQRIKEDFVRILRFFRMMTKNLGVMSWCYDEADLEAIRRNAWGLELPHISGERIWMEMEP